MTDWTSYITPL